MKMRSLSSLAVLAVAALLFTQSAVTAQVQNKGEVSLKAAMDKETLEGDPKGAIEMYKKIAESKDPALAVKAALRMAGAYQKLGDAEAQRVYEDIPRKFPEQRTAVEEAQMRLAELRTQKASAGAVVAKELQFQRGEQWSAVSFDGRYALIDSINGAILRNIVSGSNRPLTGILAQGRYSSFSRDGKKLAYYQGVSGVPNLRLVDLQEPGVPQFKTLVNNPKVDYLHPHDWTPDGRIVVTLKHKDLGWQVALVSATDGSLQVLKSLDWRHPTRVFVSPDGGYLAYDLEASETDTQRDVFARALDGSGDEVLVAGPANDVVMGWSPDGKYLLYLTERAPGLAGLSALPFAEGKAQGLPKVIKSDILTPAISMGVTRAGALYLGTFEMSPNGAIRNMRFAIVDFNDGRFASTPGVTKEFIGTEPQWSPDGSRLMHQSKYMDQEGVRAGLIVRSAATGQVERDLHPPLSLNRGDHETRWAPDGRSFVAGGEDLMGRAGIFKIDAETGRSSLLMLCPGTGSCNCPALSRDGRSLYYIRWDKNSTPLIMRDLASKKEQELFPNVGDFLLSPDGQYIALTTSGLTDLVSIIPSMGGAPRISIHGRHANWAVDSRSLLVRAGNDEVWRVFLDGQTQSISSEVSGFASFETWAQSPDGRKFGITQNTPPSNWPPAGPSGVRVVENFLPALRVDTGVAQAAQAVQANAGYQVAWLDRSGKIENIGFYGFDSSLSLDGKRLAIIRREAQGANIWIVQLDRGNALSRVTFGADTGRKDSFPVWSPDGSRLAFVSVRNGKFGLYTVRVDQTGVEEVLVETAMGPRNLQWSPDGKFIAYDIDGGLKTGSDFWAVSVTGDHMPIPILQTPFNEYAPAISPDGKWIAVVSDRTGREETFIRPFPDRAGEWRVPSTRDDRPRGAAYAQWRADSRELYFVDGVSLMAAEVRAAGTSLQLDVPREVTSVRIIKLIGVSPDGQRFLVILRP